MLLLAVVPLFCGTVLSAVTGADTVPVAVVTENGDCEAGCCFDEPAAVPKRLPPPPLVDGTVNLIAANGFFDFCPAVVDDAEEENAEKGDLLLSL